MIPIAKPFLDDEEIKAVSEVLKSGMVAQGPKVRELEEKFAKLCGTKYAVAVNSGTAALHTALHVADIKQGDEVITTPFTFIATANTILMQQAKPVFVDIDEETFNIDPKKIEEKITDKTKSIVTACEKPVVVMECGGRDFVVPNENYGLISKKFDSEDMAEKILLLIKNRKLAAKIAKNGRKHILANFSIEKVAKKFYKSFTE